MNSSQLVFGSALVIALLGLAGYYGWRQIEALRGLRLSPSLPPEDRRYVRRQAWRRLVGCGLMVLFAGMLIGSFFLAEPARQLADDLAAARARDQEPILDPAQRQFRFWYTCYWMALLLILLLIVTTAILDYLAIRRFGLRHMRQLRDDRRQMIERQVAHYRRQRNGHGEF